MVSAEANSRVGVPAGVEIVEVAPRDGLQNEARMLSVESKGELVARSVAAGARRVEVTGFARPDLVPALADADELVAALPRLPGVEYSALIVNERSYERALAAGLSAVNIVVMASDTFSLRNQRASTDAVLEIAGRVAERATTDRVRFTVTIGAAFGCPFEGEMPLDRLADVVRRVAELRPAEISLADTIGVGTPRDVEERFALLAQQAPRSLARSHFHDTRSTGIANTVAAYRAGVRVFDTALAGAGGCPFATAATGNVATEDVVYCLERMGVATGFDLEALIGSARWLAEVLGSKGSSVMRAGGFPEGGRR